MASREKEIREQLDRITLSEEFQASKGLATFLRFVVEETLAGRAEQINQRTVGIRGLGYPPNFDPLSNPAVRMQASRLRRALDKYYLTRGFDDLLRIKIPKGSYVPEFLPISSDVQNQATITVLRQATTAAIEEQTGQHDGPAIAVMQFRNLGIDKAFDFLETGLTEEVIIALTRFPEFVVVGPLNGAIIQASQLEARGIGREYNVRFLLDGAVRLRGESLRITARLTDTISGQQIWGQAHDYSIANTSIDQVEDDIVSRIVATIADNFGVIPRALSRELKTHRHENLSEYGVVLQFHHANRTLTEESVSAAISALERALERNREHDLVMAMLADLLSAPYLLGYSDNSSDLDQAERLAFEALALNPHSQQGRYALAQVHYLRFRKSSFLAEIEQVLQLNPNNANYLGISALFLSGIGQRERGLTLINRAMRLNPHHPGWYHLIPWLFHYYRSNHDAAWEEAKRFNMPDYFWDPLIRATVLGQLGRKKKAKDALHKLIDLVPDFKRRGYSLIKRMLFEDEHVAMVMEGLRKAGLEIE